MKETAPISDENISEELFSSEGLLEELFGPAAGMYLQFCRNGLLLTISERLCTVS